MTQCHSNTPLIEAILHRDVVIFVIKLHDSSAIQHITTATT